jgi:hypothetical protein
MASPAMALAAVSEWLVEEVNPTEDTFEPGRYQLLGRWVAVSRDTAGTAREWLATEERHKNDVVDQVAHRVLVLLQRCRPVDTRLNTMSLALRALAGKPLFEKLQRCKNLEELWVQTCLRSPVLDSVYSFLQMGLCSFKGWYACRTRAEEEDDEDYL